MCCKVLTQESCNAAATEFLRVRAVPAVFIYILYCDMNIKEMFFKGRCLKNGSEEEVISQLKCKDDISKSMDKGEVFFLPFIEGSKKRFQH